MHEDLGRERACLPRWLPGVTALDPAGPHPDLTWIGAATNRAPPHSLDIQLARPELGTKRVCPTTGRKFYDLNHDPIVSPYTGETIMRAALEPVRGPVASPRARPKVEDEDTDLAPAGEEVVSLEDVSAGEEAAAAADEDVAIEEEGTRDDDTFLEEEEEAGDDVADLIDGDIESEEES